LSGTKCNWRGRDLPVQRVSVKEPETADGLDYAYDAQNHRIWSWKGFTEDSNNNMINYTVNIYSPGGQKLAAYTLSPTILALQQASYTCLKVTLSSADAYFGSRRLAAMDQLGSPVKLASPGPYYPWGENKGGTSPQDTWNYATYWRDSYTALDYANNRYYSNASSRFMTQTIRRVASA